MKFKFSIIMIFIIVNLFAQNNEDSQPLQKTRSSFSTIGSIRERSNYLDHKYISQNGSYKFHYTLDGQDAIDSTCTNSLNIPDWIYEAEIAINKAHDILINDLGFEPPPGDGDEYDIYIQNLNAYGFTIDETLNTITSRPNDYISFMKVDNDFKGHDTEGIPALRVTMVHEYFHAVQLGYAFNKTNHLQQMNDGDTYFLEWSSTWFEDYCYPKVNDYVNYVKNYFNYSHYPIWDSIYYYAHGAFLKYLIDNYSTKILTKTLNKMKNGKRAFFALTETIQEETNTTLSKIYNEYCMKMYFSGSNYDENFAVSEDAKYFPSNYYVHYNHRFDYDRYININISSHPYSTTPIEIAINTSDFIGLKKFEDFSKKFYGRYIFKHKKNYKTSRFNLNSDHYISKSGKSDTLLLFITNKELDETLNIDISIGYVEPDQFIIVDKIFPNPVDGNGHVCYRITCNELTKFVNISMYNLLGQQLFTKNIQYYPNRINSIDFKKDIAKPLASGIYFLRFKADNKEEIKKITLVN